MSYSEFTLENLRRRLGIRMRDHAFFDPLDEIAASPWLVQSLEFGHSVYTTTEKARGEFIVAPTLLECRKLVAKGINVFSGVTLSGDSELGLVGECDFVFARTQSRMDLHTPLMVVAQAKKHDILATVGPCAAQMLGVLNYNERFRTFLPCVYGCVTNGFSWVFLKMQGNDLQLHPRRIAINEVNKILWLFVQSLQDVERQTGSASRNRS